MDSSYMNNAAKVIMPMIRRVMPNIIAQQLVGVQPMTAPSAKIFNTLYGTSADPRHVRRMSKEHYKVFLRLNDRKKFQKYEDFIEAKYPYAIVDYSAVTVNNARKFCLEQFGQYGYVWFNNGCIFFENKDDHLIFLLWGGGGP